MTNDSYLHITAHILLSKGGGGGRAFSVSSIPPTVSVPENFSLKHL